MTGARATTYLTHHICDSCLQLQENPNSIPEGETPHSVTLFGHDHLVDMAKPGDRITLTGIYKMEGVRVNPRIRMLRSIYKTFIDAIHIAMEERSPLFSVKTGAAPEDNTMLSQDTPPDSEQVPMMVCLLAWTCLLYCTASMLGSLVCIWQSSCWTWLRAVTTMIQFKRYNANTFLSLLFV